MQQSQLLVFGTLHALAKLPIVTVGLPAFTFARSYLTIYRGDEDISALLSVSFRSLPRDIGGQPRKFSYG